MLCTATLCSERLLVLDAETQRPFQEDLDSPKHPWARHKAGAGDELH